MWHILAALMIKVPVVDGLYHIIPPNSGKKWHGVVLSAADYMLQAGSPPNVGWIGS